MQLFIINFCHVQCKIKHSFNARSKDGFEIGPNDGSEDGSKVGLKDGPNDSSNVGSNERSNNGSIPGASYVHGVTLSFVILQ